MTTHSPGGIWVLITLGGEISPCFCARLHVLGGREGSMFAAVRMCGYVHVMCPLQDLQVTPFHRFAHVSLGRIEEGG